jgi:hypothetical protein
VQIEFDQVGDKDKLEKILLAEITEILLLKKIKESNNCNQKQF